jgi:FkbM family methyltransferase
LINGLDKTEYFLTKKNELLEMLSESITKAEKRERSTFDILTEPLSGNLVLFGAGGLGRSIMKKLRTAGVKAEAFSDNNPDLWGRTVDGVRIYSPEDAAKRFGSKAAFVVTIWGAESGHAFINTRRQLKDLHCSRVVSFIPLFWKYPEIFLPYYCLDLPSRILKQKDYVINCLSIWEDNVSFDEYIAHLRWRLSLDFDGLPSPDLQCQYFPKGIFLLSEEEVFVDCGAFDGDTIREYIRHNNGSFKKIIALEPDPSSFRNLTGYISGLDESIQDRITVLPFAIGSVNRRVNFSAIGMPSSGMNGEGTLEIDIRRLDDIIGNVSPTYIKMDIEGSEEDALAGASGTIRSSKPLLAVSAYHRQGDIWEIPLFIRSLSEDYHFFLRSHRNESWDLVCYAVPGDRLRAIRNY